MNLKVIYIRELEFFVSHQNLGSSKNIPITPERAISQARNPHALADDPALILAFNSQDNLVGYIGLLPGPTVAASQRIFFNSCWWVDPMAGRGVAMPLFYKMIELTGGRLIFFELTPITDKIVRALGGFIHHESRTGVHIWFKGGLKYKLTNKFSARRLSSWIGNLLDGLLNLYAEPRLKHWCKKIIPELSVNEYQPSTIDKSGIGTFLSEWSVHHFLSRSLDEVKWILTYSWLTKNPIVAPERYAFSWKVKTFETKVISLSVKQKMVGCIVLTFRDGMCKIPLFYILPEFEQAAARWFLQYLPGTKAYGLITWNKHIISAVADTSFPVIRTRKVEKRVAWSEHLAELIPEGWYPEDGDGDGIFT